VAHRWGVRAEAAKRSGLLVPVGMAMRQSVARRAGLDGRVVHSLHEPVPAAEQHHRGGRERVLARIRARELAAGAVVRNERVRKRHDRAERRHSRAAIGWHKKTPAHALVSGT
jgi:hypothetical protein